MLKFLIEGSDKGGDKYILKDLSPLKERKYWKTRDNRDLTGNSPLHYCFEVQNKEKRYQMFEMLVRNGIGDIHERNKMGLLP